MAFLAEKTMGPQWVTAAKIVSVLGIALINGSIIIGSVVEISGILNTYFNFGQVILKFIILSIVLIITVVCLEPERLKPVGYVSGGIVIIIGTLVSR